MSKVKLVEGTNYKYSTTICSKCEITIKETHFVTISLSRKDDWDATSWYCIDCADKFCEALKNALKEFKYLDTK
ncbi:MAG: hypothetical protein LC122_02610 [Chitinophagales bacterium]|nr:hypothetical protein [Chitinophagales bacterium]